MTLRDHRQLSGEQTLQADVVIVGTGPGGAAIGRVLAQAGRTVIFLEEGPATPRFRPNLAHTQRYHMQENGAVVAQSPNSFVPIAAGRGVGGGSLINSAICWRTPDYVLEDWCQRLGVDTYAPRAMAPIFAALEERLQIAETPDRIAGENNRIIVRGARAMGLPGGLLRRNTPACNGCGLCNMGCPTGGKASVDRNLVLDARESGATVCGDVRVDRLLLDQGTARGVVGTVRHPDSRDVLGTLTVRAPTVVLAAGAIGTPRLLWESGAAHGLGPAVGQGLHLHPGNAVVGLCDHEVIMWRGATQGAWFEDPDLPGVLPHTLQAEPGVVLMMFGRTGHEAKALMPKLPHMCGAVVMISDKGSGSVGARADGRAAVRYEFDPHDVARIKQGMVRTAEVLLAGGAREVTAPVRGMQLHRDVGAFADNLAPTTIRDFGLYAAHPMATCRMGTDPATSVIRPDGRTHHAKGLYIADSSVFPTSLGVNPQLTTMAMATMIGHQLVGNPASIR